MDTIADSADGAQEELKAVYKSLKRQQERMPGNSPLAYVINDIAMKIGHAALCLQEITSAVRTLTQIVDANRPGSRSDLTPEARRQQDVAAACDLLAQYDEVPREVFVLLNPFLREKDGEEG